MTLPHMRSAYALDHFCVAIAYSYSGSAIMLFSRVVVLSIWL